jgi:hypothetical protein
VYEKILFCNCPANESIILVLFLHKTMFDFAKFQIKSFFVYFDCFNSCLVQSCFVLLFTCNVYLHFAFIMIIIFGQAADDICFRVIIYFEDAFKIHL